MEDRLFRDAMGQFATGITVVTGNFEEETYGMTVNAFMSVSLNPKLITVSIGNNAFLYNKLQNLDRFGVSVLKESQKDLSKIYARQMEKGKDIIFESLDGAPVIKGSMVTLSCQVCDTVKAGDHMLYIARVMDLQIKEGNPLIYFGSQYCYLK